MKNEHRFDWLTHALPLGELLLAIAVMVAGILWALFFLGVTDAAKP